MVIITGSHGYIGKHVRQHFPHAELVDLEIDVNVLDRGYKDTVIHLAAESGVVACERNPVAMLRNNIYATLYIAERAPRIVFASTVGVEAPTSSAYTMSKFIGESIIKSYMDDYVILRFGNVYGGTMEKDNVVNRFLQRAKNGQDLEVYAPGTQKRDFIHVDDVARVIADVAEYSNGTIDVVSGTSMSIIDVAELICDASGVDYSVVSNPRTKNEQSVSFDHGVPVEHTLSEFITDTLLQ